MVRICRLLPPKWETYTPVGEVIPKTRFIVFKTPLNDRLLTKVSRDKRFNINMLLRMMAENNQRLGMVIDLTDTTRYYDKRDLEGMCIEYEKIHCPGRGFVDNDDAVTAFNHAIQKYTERSDDSDALIGVHCTDGVNRSGYLICRFLIEHLGWSSHEALDAFERARGYPIEKGSYVLELHKAAKKAQDKAKQKGEGVAEENSDSDSEGRRKKKKKNKRKRDLEEEDTGVGDLMQQFLGEITQQAKEIQGEMHSPMASNYVESPRQKHWAYKAKRQKLEEKVKITEKRGETSFEQVISAETEADEEEEDVAAEEVEEDNEYAEAEGLTKAQKRRARKARQQKMLHVMRRGNFHEIREMQEEYMKQQGAKL